MGAIYNGWVLKPLVLALLLSASPCVPAQTTLSAHEKVGGGKVVLVLPFDNRSGNAALNWIGDSFPDTLNQRLSSAGFLALSHDDRLYALDHLGLPAEFKPTRATTIRLAQTLDADYVIVGSFTLEGTGPTARISVQAQTLEVNKLRLSKPVADSAELGRLFDVENAIAWTIARQIEPHFAVAEQTFLAASAGIRLSAFENYIRGTGAGTPAERVKHLEIAVADSPSYAAADLALGKQLYTDREYDRAAATLAKVPTDDRLALEANFYIGLARFNAGKYAEAERAFAFVAARLPLPEVLNDQGVALSRQGKDGSPLFQKAIATDPNDADYHYNLAIDEYKRGDFAGAGKDIDGVLKLQPKDGEAVQLRALISAGRATTPPAPGGFAPSARLKRGYSEASYRQATFQLDQVRTMRIAILPPAQQAAEYTQLGRDYLGQGLLPEAEEQFNAAVAADARSAAGHLGLALVRERSGSVEDARTEAQAAIRIAPSVDAYLVLARTDLQKNNLPGATAEVQQALKLEPKNAAALGVRQTLEQRGQSFQ